MSAALNLNDFDAKKIRWQAFGSYTGFAYRLLNVDLESKVIDMLFRFEPERRCFYHTHHQPSSTLVVQGEQHIWEPGIAADAEHKIRKAGEFAASQGAETHIEGGGKEGCVIYMSVRCQGGPVYSILNDDLTTRLDVSLEDFATAFAKQN